ncbi:MAG TPA: alpha-L-arabinofuranosidase C-terminal domain-containing protein [Acidobacteriaceae bacterium]|nr:alpha-L-arabinofuranosidase C-terminal domain-containing protein [Acidobacteriaceae bacterium]
MPFLVAATAGAQSAAPTLSIDLAQVKGKASPMLYGLMTEEINYSYDGGIYGELVRNRTFQDNRRSPAHWVIDEAGDADASMALDTSTGPSTALPLSLALTIRNATPAEPAGITNEGYWGIPVRPNTVYHGSFYAKAGDPGVGPIAVKLMNNDTGHVVASATVSSLSPDWKQYEFTLRSDASPASSANRLILSAGKPGKIWFSLVSLFPPTYHDRVNGNRIDLMEKLAAMHPAFLRLPGGNYLEGNHIDERFEWKKTIGPLVDRPTHLSPWNYRSSDGMGLLEFLEWCEDLKMQPLLAVYAGYSLRGEHVEPGNDLTPYVNDALDELEYVTGSTSTKWGAERARDGHPEPFKLTYVEIGNEDWFDKSGSYDGRYTQFYKAIKAKYPDLQLIATTPVKGITPDVVDDHYYRSAQQFYEDVGHYDKTDRKGPKIFVGEWATREGGPTPNFGAALGDAAWMTGMERNSDIVVMASYAPLLVNVNPGGMQWESDLIGYNALHSYGSPSYYAQVMFSNHLGDQILNATLDGEATRFFYSVTRSSRDGKLYLKLVNATSNPSVVKIQLTGGSVARNGKMVALSAKTTAATNSITEPEKIVPVESTINDAGARFSHTMPPYSIQVLELQTH